MKIVKQINNNAALAVDSSGKEPAVLGRGVGFPRMPYALTDLSRVERTFYDVNPNYFMHLSAGVQAKGAYPYFAQRVFEENGIHLEIAEDGRTALRYTMEIKERYGMICVDLNTDGPGTLERYRKKSLYWYKEVIAANGESLQLNRAFP